MSATAKDYVYHVKVTEKKPSKEATISQETLLKYKADVAKYLTKSK